MAKFQISLNGSNFTDKNRQQKFEDSLQDQHQVDCGDGNGLKVAEHDPSNDVSRKQEAHANFSPNGKNTGNGSSDQLKSENLALALEHTYAHQSKTMEIHQQYLSQQAEYLELITAVLNQQGKVLDQRNGSGDTGIIETFQKTLDNFHQIRQQGLRVHHEFLTQQESFSERYLKAVENGHHAKPAQGERTDRTKTPQQAAPAEWVVKVPPIVLDEKASVSTEQVINIDKPAEIIKSDNAISTDKLSESLLRIVADKTGYPSEMLELDMDLEADLGIDSIKRVEILGALEDEFPTLPSADTEILSQTRTLKEIVDYMNEGAGSAVKADQVQPEAIIIDVKTESKSNQSTPVSTQPDTRFSVQELTGVLLEIVAEKTGYPVEMLEVDMDMEADLGIDSIKRVEILGSMEEKVPGLPSVETEALAELRTLGQIVEMMSSSKPSDEIDYLNPCQLD
jgi:acyl carrier protein